MEHTNTIAIKILKKQYSDYPENAWHYDDQYKMMVQAMEEATDLLAVKTLPTERDIYIAANEYSDKENFRSGKHKSYISVNFVTGAKWALSKLPVSEAGEQEKEDYKRGYDQGYYDAHLEYASKPGDF